MKLLTSNDMPYFIKREVEKLQENIQPLMKKASKYMFWSFPLITISLINLFFLVIVMPVNKESSMSILLYAIIGAIGMALSKETKYKRKEIINVSSTFVIDRIHQSDILHESRKTYYISLVKKQPMLAYNILIEFLNEENHRKDLDS